MVGCPMIGMPDYNKLLVGRAQEANASLTPPTIPKTFATLVNETNPANLPYTAKNDTNPFWNKKVLTTNGGADPLVHFDYSREFLANLVLGPEKSSNDSLEVFVQPQVPHFVMPQSALPTAGATDPQ